MIFYLFQLLFLCSSLFAADWSTGAGLGEESFVLDESLMAQHLEEPQFAKAQAGRNLAQASMTLAEASPWQGELRILKEIPYSYPGSRYKVETQALQEFEADSKNNP